MPSASRGARCSRETRALARLVAAADPELVHLHSAKAGLAGRAAVRGRRTTVFQPHAWSFEVSGPQRRAALAWERFAARRWTDLVLCVSETERRRAEECGIRARFATVHNGIDLQRHSPAGEAERRLARARLGLGGHPLVLALGRLSEQKGQDVLLRAWPAVLERVPEAELLLVGEGPARAGLEAQGRPRVRFEGARTDVSAWLAAADVVAMPSRWEGFSLGHARGHGERAQRGRYRRGRSARGTRGCRRDRAGWRDSAARRRARGATGRPGPRRARGSGGAPPRRAGLRPRERHGSRRPAL